MVSQASWLLARSAVTRAGDQFAQVLTAAPDPAALATRHWSIAQTAAHVAAVAALDARLLQPDQVPDPFPGIWDALPGTTVDMVADLNEQMLALFPERDPSALAQQLKEDIARIVDAADPDPDRTVTWLGGSRLPVAGLVAHLLNELLIHGRDLARATAAPWRIGSPEAALFFELFLLELARCGYGRLLDTDQPAPVGRIEVEFRSRHLAPFTFVMDDGLVAVAEPDRPDVRLRFDPAVLVLMLFGRVSRPRAVLTGKLQVWGRRPWLLPGFFRILRVPD